MEKLILKNYDVALEKLTEDKIELVRMWRNDYKISKFMEFNDYITPDMQAAWFHKIDNDNNYYFIIKYKGSELGLINIKDYDHTTKIGESGIFIYEDKYLNSDIAYRANLVMFDYIFGVIGADMIKAHIKEENSRAARLCLFIGFRQSSQTQYTLKKEEYYQNTNRERFINRWYKQLNKRNNDKHREV